MNNADCKYRAFPIVLYLLLVALVNKRINDVALSFALHLLLNLLAWYYYEQFTPQSNVSINDACYRIAIAHFTLLVPCCHDGIMNNYEQCSL